MSEGKPVRTVERHYRDPLEEIWLRAAADVGLRVVRSGEVYASYDGGGTIAIGERPELDADDHLAQMLLHELCHALVAGEGATDRVDWGLSNVDERDLVAEHACQRVQAAFAGRHGLRDFLAVTTDHRPYWDALPDDPLAPGDAVPSGCTPDGEQAAIERARAAWVRARRGRWWGVLERALAATAELARVVAEHAPPSSLWRTPSERQRSTGLPLHRHASRRCRDCAWSYRFHGSLRCRQLRAEDGQCVRIEASERACERWEARFDERGCAPCGACCREGFDLVELRRGDAFLRKHPEMVAVANGLARAHVPRPDGRCVALVGDGAAAGAYRCSVYAERPRSCREFEVGSDACLEARRRVGLSR